VQSMVTAGEPRYALQQTARCEATRFFRKAETGRAIPAQRAAHSARKASPKACGAVCAGQRLRVVQQRRHPANTDNVPIRSRCVGSMPAKQTATSAYG